ncbi:uncharacterized protein [Spinacia oleracea]|uniref:Uncharacterized protein n=1 Tax=Spinacia oleracea TaxID=3562 RepID=A0ABM3RRR7_SPIOL|nr:uncharacterized protein LOC130471959 [Spinacia oleracea]
MGVPHCLVVNSLLVVLCASDNAKNATELFSLSQRTLHCSCSKEEKSAAAKKSAGGHLYHQKRARRGYARFEQDVIEEMAKKRIYVSSVSRAQLWKLMRTNNKGNIQEGAKEVAKRIDYFMHQAEKGEIEDTGRLDVLYKALEEKRYGGRVRGVGVGVTNTDYFGAITTRKEYMDQVTKLCSRVKILEREIKDMKRRKPKGRKNHSVEEEEDEEEEEKDDEEEKDEEEEEDDEMDVEEENLDGLMLDHIQDTPISSSPEISLWTVIIDISSQQMSNSILQSAAYCSQQQRTAVSSSILQ